MKKYVKKHLFIALILLSQVFLILKIYRLDSQLVSLQNSVDSQTSFVSQDINNMYSDIENLLIKTENPIEFSKAELGKVNKEGLTVAINFSLLPKEVTDKTIVSLDFDGQIYPMDKNGVNFTATVDRDIFSPAIPTIIIDEDGKKKIVKDDEFGFEDLKDWILAGLYVYLPGSASDSNDIYRREGFLHVESTGHNNLIDFTEIYLLVKVEDKIFSKEDIPKESFYGAFKVDKKIPLKNGQVATMTVVAIDSLGLEHHFIVDRWVGGSTGPEDFGFGAEHIYSPDGQLLWKSE